MNKNKKMSLGLGALVASALSVGIFAGFTAKGALADGETKNDLATAIDSYLAEKDTESLSARDVAGLSVVKALAIEKGNGVFDASGYTEALAAAKEVVDRAPMFASLKEVGRPYTTRDLRPDRMVSQASGKGDSTNNTSGELAVPSDSNYSMSASFFFKNTEIIDGEDAHVILRTSDGSNGYKFSFDMNYSDEHTISFSANGSLLATFDAPLSASNASLIEMYAVDYVDSGVCMYMYLDNEFLGYVPVDTVINNKKINHLCHVMGSPEPYCCSFATVYAENIKELTATPVGLAGGKNSSSQFEITVAEENDAPAAKRSDANLEKCFRALDDDVIVINGYETTSELHRANHTFYKNDVTTYSTDEVNRYLSAASSTGIVAGDIVSIGGRSLRSDEDTRTSYILSMTPTKFVSDGSGYISVKEAIMQYAEELDKTGLNDSQVDSVMSYAETVADLIVPNITSKAHLDAAKTTISNFATALANFNECAPTKSLADLRSPRVISGAIGSGDSTNNAGTIAKVSDNNYSQHVRVNYYNGGVHNYTNFGDFDARYVLRSNSNGNEGYGFTFKNTSDDKARVGIQVNNVTSTAATIVMPVGVVHTVEMYAVNSKDNTKVYCYLAIDGNVVLFYETTTIVNNESARHQVNSTSGKWVGFGTNYEEQVDIGEIQFTKTAVVANDKTSSNVFYLEAKESNEMPVTQGTNGVSGNEYVYVHANADSNFKLNGQTLASYNYCRQGGSINKVDDKLYEVNMELFVGSKTTVAVGDTLEISGSYIYSDVNGTHKSYTFSVPTLTFKYVAENTWERVVSLEEKIDDAKGELLAYRSAEIEEYLVDVSHIIASAMADLDLATDETAIAHILDNAKTSIDIAISEAMSSRALEAAKAIAMDEIDHYVDMNNYRSYEQGVIEAIIGAGKDLISEADSVETIDDIVASVKAQLDEVKTSAEYEAEEALAAAKESAIQELQSYANPDDYDDAGKAALEAAITAGINSIQQAESIDAVNAALANAKMDIDSIEKKSDVESSETTSSTPVEESSEATSVTDTSGTSSVEETSSSSQDKPSGGCGGSILAASALVSALAVAGLTICLKKRKEN